MTTGTDSPLPRTLGAVSPAGLQPRRFAELPVLAKANLLGLLALCAAMTALLWPHWRDNPELSHGFLMPLVFGLLLHEARTGTPRFLSNGRSAAALVLVLLALGALMLCAAGVYATALDWPHSLVACTLTIALVLLLGAGLVAFATERVRFIPLNWSAGAALALWLLSTPIPPGTYGRLTLGLQLAVTENVLRALHLLGIAAARHGNIIDLATTSVGVEEACSGIRSLISCVFAGVLFSATLVRRPWARALIILVSAPLAVFMNFARSLTLTLLANAGVNISGPWHDLTGFAVLGVTAVILALAALLLQRASVARPRRLPPHRHSRPARPAPLATVGTKHDTSDRPSRGLPGLQVGLAVGLTGVLGLVVFFFVNTRPSIRHAVPVPNLAAVLPAESVGWQVETSHDLYQFSATLHTSHLAQRTYLRETPNGIEQVTVYLAYWRAGQAPVSLVASHTPDACWPGSGWTPITVPRSREPLAIAARVLPDAESRRFESGEFAQYVWFWHLYDGHPIAYRNPYSARELLRSAWQYGFSHDGDQLFVRISSNRPWTALASDPLLADIFSRLQPLGL